MKLTEEVINEIRNSANIVDIIGHYIPLIKKGKDYKAVCPFHDDHDPSLSISEDKQIYKCFVCGKGGNVFSFVMDFKKCSFPEAVKEVADIIGKPIDIEVAPKKVSKYQKYYDILNSTISYSNYLLLGSKKGQDPLNYLKNRGINEEEIKYFEIGYNPDENYIYKYLNKQGYLDEDLIAVGVCRLRDVGMSDVFYNRILFPIHDYEGNPLAFSARDYLGTSDSKYINTSDTIIYTKGEVIYNYHRAKDQARKLGYLIVCEGVMDVIAYYRAGFMNVVATLGTACTNKQLELLGSLSKNIVLSYDGDKAGKAANLKLGELALKTGYEVSVVNNPTELDPDEIINKYGSHVLKDQVGHRLNFIDFAINYYKENLNLENYNDRKKMTILISNYIDLLKDNYDKENYTNYLYEITKIKRIANKIENKKEYNKKVVPNYTIDGLTKAEYVILLQIAQYPQASKLYQKELGCLLDDKNQKLAMLIIDDYRKNNECRLSRLYDETDDEDIKNIITNLALYDSINDSFDEKLLLGAINKVKREIKQRKLKDLKDKISKYENVDKDMANNYLKEYLDLVRELGEKL